MNEKLKEKTQEWMRLERKTLEQRRIADQYYDTNLMKLIEEDFIERNQSVVTEPVKNLVVSVGTSYEPIVLNIALLKPEKILFLYTKVSEKTLDKIVEYSGLRPSAYEKRQVNEISPIDIYREIRDAYLLWERPERMYIDFTGGTKAMSAAAALAGAMIDLQMIYVATDDYLVDFRKPNPGSERLVYIENPLAVFGDLEVEKAIELYGENNFAGAREKIEAVKDSIPDPVLRQELSFYHLLTCAYEAWDALDFVNASDYMTELIRQIKRDGRNYPGNVLVNTGSILGRQGDYLSVLATIPKLINEKKQKEILKNKDMIIPLMFTMWMNAITRQEQHKLDMATLLLYRLLEMIEQRRLATYNLFVSEMRYSEITINKKRTPEAGKLDESARAEWLRHEVINIKKEIFNSKVSEYLPNPVSLLEGFIILSALHDPIVYEPDRDRINILKQIRAKVFLRNNSIFAHGLGPVSEEDYAKFRDFVTKMFIKFCEVEHIQFDEYESVFAWIRLDDSEVK